MRLLTLLAVFACVVAAPAVAGPFEDAQSAEYRRDYVKALRLYRLAAEQGHAEAAFSVANFYFIGRAVPQDYVEYEKWLKRAADLGSADAMLAFSFHYAISDRVEADKWRRLAEIKFRERAERGDSASQYMLSSIVVDNVEKHMWLNICASGSGLMARQAALAREKLSNQMTAAQVAEAQKLAREWKHAKP